AAPLIEKETSPCVRAQDAWILRGTTLHPVERGMRISWSLSAMSMLTISASAVAQQATWDARAAAKYLDARQTWWSSWPTAARDHQTACVSCHTALPFALARPALRSELGETEVASAERRMVDDVIKRVRLWRDVEPFYPDQTRGLPKTSESRGTE